MPLSEEGRQLLQAWLAVIGYCLGTGSVAAASYISRFPPSQLEGMFTFMPRMWTSEFSHTLLALQLLAAAKFPWKFVAHVAASPAGRSHRLPLTGLAAFSAVSTIVGARHLFQLARSNLTARALFRKCVSQAGIPADFLDRAPSATRRLASVLPVWTLLKGDITFTTATYARVGVHRLKLDVIRHPSHLAPAAPVIMHLHGGGWVTGHRHMSCLPMLYDFASAGYLVVTVNYRLSPGVAFPEHLVDCKRALAWVRRHAAEYGGDGTRVIVSGDSAGGQLASLMALTANNSRYQPGFPEVDTQVLGCIDLYGLHDMYDTHDVLATRDQKKGLLSFLERFVIKEARVTKPDVFKDASPYQVLKRRLEEDSFAVHHHYPVPPFFVVHGVLDTLIPVEDFRHFTSLLKTYRSREQHASQVNSVALAFGSTESWDPDSGFFATPPAATASSAAPAEPAPDVFVELPDTHHAFNYMLSPRTLALSDAARDFASHVIRTHTARRAAGKTVEQPARFPFVSSKL